MVEKSRPILLLQVNSTDDWQRHRIEGYGFLRFPSTPGYHQLTVETWRPRASLDTEIHSFFLGGSVRIRKLEELTRTAFVDSKGRNEIVNRFGLETEDAGRVKINMNLSSQDVRTRKDSRYVRSQVKEQEKLETRRLVMKYSLELQQRTQKRKAAGSPEASDDDDAVGPPNARY